MTVFDMAEIVAALALIAAYVSLVRWFRTQYRNWRVAVPAIGWLLNASAFVAVVIFIDTQGLSFPLNLWGLALIVHAAITFAIYFSFMGINPHDSR